ncbi:MAG: hypothetical protein KGZ74_02935 [Chitinophagaceae bacterium]|nr:hypothetical protein [Chitinophagaceae bacterium]
MYLQLLRQYGERGTNGTLFLNGKKVCHTIELPWKNNAVRISCIPERTYRLQLRNSPRFGTHLLVKEVPGRSLILVHAANDALQELKGCIAPVTTLTGEGKGRQSRVALAKLMHLVLPLLKQGHPVFLNIQNAK